MSKNGFQRIKLRLKKNENKCYYCGKTMTHEEMTIDHLIHKCKGGKNNYNNLRLCCYDCNQEKSDMTEEEFSEFKKSYIPKEKPKYYEKIMCIDLIKIPWLFKQNEVGKKKIEKVLNYYNTYKKFDKPVTLKSETNNNLIDGYSRYVVAKMLGLNEIPAIYQN
jgi:predicted GIY-YIG superfamily endonuclease